MSPLSPTPNQKQIPAKRFSLAFLLALSFHLLIAFFIFVSAIKAEQEAVLPVVDNAVIISAMAVQEQPKTSASSPMTTTTSDNTVHIDESITQEKQQTEPISNKNTSATDPHIMEEKKRLSEEPAKRDAALLLAAQEKAKNEQALKLAEEQKIKELALAQQKLALEQKAKLDAELKAKRELELKLAADQKAKAEADQKVANEQKAKLAAEKVAEQEAMKKRLDDENEKKLAIKRKIEDFARQKREADLARIKQDNEKLEAEKAQQQAVLARTTMVSKTIDKYKAMILDAIARQWIPPASADKTQQAKLLVRVASNGTVLSVTILHASGNEALDRSAEFAVYKASPLPVPDDPEAFLPFQNLHLTVRKEGVLS